MNKTLKPLFACLFSGLICTGAAAAEPQVINIKTDGRFWRYLRWRDFCDKYHADRFATAALKQSASDHANWYICESEIPLADFAKVEFLDQDGLYKEAHHIPGFSLEDVAPELFA